MVIIIEVIANPMDREEVKIRQALKKALDGLDLQTTIAINFDDE